MKALGGRKIVFRFSWAAMEFVWRYAWAVFISLSTTDRTFPLTAGLGTFVAAALFSAWARGKKLRLISVYGLHAAGFGIAALPTIHYFYFPSRPYYPFGWIAGIPKALKTPEQWIVFFCLLIPVIFFWKGGSGFSRKPSERRIVWFRFDLGIGAFFGLLFFNYAFGLKLSAPEAFIPPFFIFALVGLGTVENTADEKRVHLSGWPGMAALFGFILTVAMLSIAVIAFALPYLTLAADFGYEILKPLGPVFTSVLLFIFSHGNRLQEGAGGKVPTDTADALRTTHPDFGTHGGILEMIIGWGLLGVISLFCLAALAAACWLLFRRLMSRGIPDVDRGPFSFRLWIAAVHARLKAFRAKIRRRRFGKAGRFYIKLVAWGRRSGAPLLCGETPLEYGIRLKHRFPGLAEEIDVVVAAYQAETYAEEILTDSHAEKLRKSFRRMCSPLQWPRRIRSGGGRCGRSMKPIMMRRALDDSRDTPSGTRRRPASSHAPPC